MQRCKNVQRPCFQTSASKTEFKTQYAQESYDNHSPCYAFVRFIYNSSLRLLKHQIFCIIHGRHVFIMPSTVVFLYDLTSALS